MELSPHYPQHKVHVLAIATAKESMTQAATTKDRSFCVRCQQLIRQAHQVVSMRKTKVSFQFC